MPKKGQHHTEEWKRQMSLRMSGPDNPHIGRRASEETRRKMSLSHLGSKRTLETRRRMALAQIGKKHPHTMESRKRIGAASKGRPCSEYAIACRRKMMKSRWANPEYRKAQCEMSRNLWRNPEYIAKFHHKTTINKTEARLLGILEGILPCEYRYVGDFSASFGGRSPDFMNINGRKKLIELFGDFWHKGEDPQPRIDHFKQFGFDTLVIWESEMKDESMLRAKILQWHAQ